MYYIYGTIGGVFLVPDKHLLNYHNIYFLISDNNRDTDHW